METLLPVEILRQNQSILEDLIAVYKKEREPNVAEGERVPTQEEIKDFVNNEIVPSLVMLDTNEKGRRKDSLVQVLKDAGIEVPVDLLHT